MQPSSHVMDDLLAPVRAGDYTRFLCIQLAPPAARPALLALTAFSIELAQIAEQVSEAMLGHIRLAWWREALTEIEAAATPRRHPVVLALADIYATHPEIFPLLHHMIEAREVDLDPELLPTIATWRAYLDHTAGALHLAWAMLLDPALDVPHRDRVVHEARAYAMVGLLHAIPYHARHGFQRFSAEQLQAANLAELAPSGALNRWALGLAEEALPMLTAQRWPRALRPMAGLAAATRLGVKKLRKAKGDPYRVAPSPFALVWRIWCAR